LRCRTLSLPGCEISWFVFVVRLADSAASEQRDRILQAMRERGIQVNNYFSPAHLQPFMVERFGSKPSI
jgi:perosamine synthetase